MPDLLQTATVHCPYCGEAFEALLDPGEGGSVYVQDCEICCNPIRFAVDGGPAGALTVSTAREDD